MQIGVYVMSSILHETLIKMEQIVMAQLKSTSLESDSIACASMLPLVVGVKVKSGEFIFIRLCQQLQTHTHTFTDKDRHSHSHTDKHTHALQLNATLWWSFAHYK